MKFEYPNFLYAFLVLIIPILIHLFNFKKYKTLYFSSLVFLRKVDEQTKSTQKLKHYLVLAARLLCFSFLVLAFAKPYFPGNSSENAGDKIYSIYLDNSYSMSAKGAEGNLLSEAKEQAKRIIHSLDNTSKIYILSNALDGSEQHSISKSDAVDKIDKITFNNQTRTLSEIVNFAREEVKNTESIHSFVLLSDFQKTNSDIQALQYKEHEAYNFIQLKPQSTRNLSVDSVWFESPVFKKGASNTIYVQLKNHSAEAATNEELHVEIGNVKRDLFVDIPAHSSKTVQFEYIDHSLGLKKGFAQINDKQVLFDDRYFFSYTVYENSNILLANGPQAVKNIQVVYELDPLYKIQEVDVNNLNDEQVKGQDLVVLNGINQINIATQNLLHDFVKNGGSLAIFFGTEIDITTCNSLLSSFDLPVIQGESSEGNKMKTIAYQDEFFKNVFEKSPQNINSMGQVISYTTKLAGKNATPLITLQNGNLFLAKSNKFSAYAVYSSLDSKHGLFTQTSLFSTLLLRMGEMSGKSQVLALTFGEEQLFPIYGKHDDQQAIHLKKDQIDFIPETIKSQNRWYINLSKIPSFEQLEAGNYQITQSEEIGNLSINNPRIESNLEAHSMSEMQSVLQKNNFKNSQFSVLDKGQSQASIAIDKPQQLWKTLLLLAVLFVILEIMLIRFMK